MKLRLGASFFLILAVALTARLILVPSVAGLRPFLYPLAALGLGLGLWLFVRPQNRTPWLFFILLLPATAFLFPMVTIARTFRRLDMVALMFHIEAGIGDASLQGLESELAQGAMASLFLLFAFLALQRIWGMNRLAIVAMFGLMVLINPLTATTMALTLASPPKVDLVARLAEPVPVHSLSKPVDLLLVYLEGTDRQFADEANWGDAYAPLHLIANEGTSLTRVGQIAGTGWSLAGLVATQCGVPIPRRRLLQGNDLATLKSFMPAMPCLGDVLSAQGYSLTSVVGAPLSFGRLDLFGYDHGFNKVVGRDEIKRFSPPQDYDKALIGWILDDQMTFAEATRQHIDLLSQAKPYALIVETIGPHGHKGYLSRHCADGIKARFDTDEDKVLRCTINDAAAFVAEARARQQALRPDRPLLIVVASDHLNHNPGTPPPAAEFAGYNTVILAGAGVPAGIVIDKPGSMIDLYPTMLQAMGVINAPFNAGLGKSLLSDQATLVEEFGVDGLEPILLLDRDLSIQVWRDAEK